MNTLAGTSDVLPDTPTTEVPPSTLESSNLSDGSPESPIDPPSALELSSMSVASLFANLFTNGETWRPMESRDGEVQDRG